MVLPDNKPIPHLPTSAASACILVLVCMYTVGAKQRTRTKLPGGPNVDMLRDPTTLKVGEVVTQRPSAAKRSHIF